LSTSAAVAAAASGSKRVSISSVFDNPRLPSLPDEIISLLRQDSGMCGRVLKTVSFVAAAGKSGRCKSVKKKRNYFRGRPA
jgi:hypothetical protein